MRLFIDESLSPELAIRLNETGRYDAVHPLHIGRRGDPDHRVFARCLAEDRVIVAQNARDFRKLAASAEIHPGLILVPVGERSQVRGWLDAALAFIELRGDPMGLMVNHVVEVSRNGRIAIMPLPWRTTGG